MQHFIGTYECKADDKGRLMLPVSLKKQLSDKLKNGFVIKRAVFNSCLELYPLKEWDELMLRINKLNRFNKKNILRKERLKLVDKNEGVEDTYIEEDSFIKANFDDRGLKAINFHNIKLFKDKPQYEN